MVECRDHPQRRRVATHVSDLIWILFFAAIIGVIYGGLTLMYRVWRGDLD